MKSKTKIIIHFIFWILIFILNFSFLLISKNPPELSIYLTYLASLATDFFDFYVVYLFAIPVLFYKKRYLLFSLFMLSFLTAYSVVGIYGQESIQGIFNPVKGTSPFFNKFIIQFYYTVMYSLLGGFVRFAIDGFQNLYLKNQLEKQNMKSELALLRMQINPHFLFNTLNNIHKLIFKNPDQAAGSLVKLSDIMRYMIYDAEIESVSLEKEIDYLKSYINLQQLRHSDPGFIQFTITGDPARHEIAPMLFVPLIENAYKHGKKDIAAPGIIIHLNILEDSYTLDVLNYYDEVEIVSKDKTKGIGLENVKKRLTLVYPGRYDFSIEKKEGKFYVLLSVRNDNLKKPKYETEVHSH